jgi:transcriptional regulator with XRE-family HTH domain
MTNTKDIIVKLKAVREEKGLSYSDILDLMEKNGDFLSKSTLSRVFAEGSEDSSFKYEETIRPIAKALLDMETIEDTDNMDVQALKVFLKYKIQVIEDLEKKVEELNSALTREKLKYHEKLDKERGNFQKSLDFCREQIALKDKRIDQLLDSNTRLLEQLLVCPCRNDPQQ